MKYCKKPYQKVR